MLTHPRYEKKVVDYLARRGIENYLPTYTSRKTWKNRQNVSIEFPLFPGYLFTRISARERSSVLGTPGVLMILGSRMGATIPGHYIELLRTGLKLGRIQPYPQTAIGDHVRIIAGPLVGVEGILTQFRSEWRVVLSIALIRQSISIEVSRHEIELVGPATRNQMECR